MMYPTGTTPTSTHWPAEMADPSHHADPRLLSPIVESHALMSLSDQMMKASNPNSTGAAPQLSAAPAAPSSASSMQRPAGPSDDYDQEDQELEHLTTTTKGNGQNAHKQMPPPSASPSGGLGSFLGQPIALSPMFGNGGTPFGPSQTPLPGMTGTPLFAGAPSPLTFGRHVGSPLYFFPNDVKPKS